MILRKLYLKNFRAYHEITVSFDSNFNVIVGKNDVGKSTILDALAIFFEHEMVRIDIADLCKWADDYKIVIGCAFEVDRAKKYQLDTTKQSSLHNEFLLNEDGLLEIWKEWGCSKQVIAKSVKTYFHAYYLEEFQDNPLIFLTNEKLKKMYDQMNLSTCKDKKVNAQLRDALYNSSQNRRRKMMLINTDKEDSKIVWKYLVDELPLYFLFQSDRSNQDSDKDVQGPLKNITKKAVDEVKNDISKVTDIIKAKIDEVAQSTIGKLNEMEPDIAKHLEVNITTKSWDSLFSFSFDDDQGIPINKRGSGVRRLILLNYFRAESERKNTSNRNVIYAIEEPETSQHPNYQMMLFNALKNLSENIQNQVVVTTHTPEFAKNATENNLIFIKKTHNEKQPKLIEVADSKMKEIANTLGVLPYLKKVAVCLEGKNDVSFLVNLNEIPEFKEIIDLEQITLIPMVGSNLQGWVNNDSLKDFNVKEYHLYDRDKDGKYTSAVQKVNGRKNGSKAKLTNYLMIENYCPPSLIEERFGIKFTDEEKNTWGNNNIPSLVFQKNSALELASIKQIICAELSKSITKGHLDELNCWDEVKDWFLEIKELDDAR